MTDRPILFSAPMVRALLEGRKTQTRRVLSNNRFASLFNGEWSDSFVLDPGNAEWRQRDMRYAIGDRLWVRETLECANGEAVGYPADETWLPNTPWQWQRKSVPSIHMPRWASRLTLIVTDVRVQRLQEISEEDARAEGVLWVPGHGEITPADLHEGYSNYLNCREGFQVLWDSLNAGRGFGWDANPWVVAVSFRVIKQNIDQIEEAA